QLAKPNSLMENYQAIPKVITMFFDGFIGVILKHHHELRQYKRKYYNLKTKIDDTEQDPMQLIKITTFLSSIIIKMAFRRSKIWFTNLFASLCRRPQFLGSLQLILRSLHVISHTEDHEHHLEIKRMEKVDPKSRIISGPNIWPLVVIDNLDTKQKNIQA
ncbi:3248_t:CDS:1, partial [Entrophospora sp. SA101]